MGEMIQVRALLARWLPADGSLRTRVVQGAATVLSGTLYSHGLRLVGNLIMTRLLFPEAFGLMVIVGIVLSALQMFLDVGVREAVIAREEAVEDSFIDTVWTILVCRGFLLALLALAAAQPVAWLYDEPILFGLIALVSLGPAIQGFGSPYPILYEKKVWLARVVFWRASTQTLALLLTIVWLLILPSVWALAAHGIIAAVISSASSYLIFRERLPRIRFDSRYAGELFRFGRWVMVATGLTFVVRQGDSIVVSQWASAAELGVFSIAATLSKMIGLLTAGLGASLLFPVYAELKSGSLAAFRARLRKIKLAMFTMCFPIVLTLSVFGRDIIELLYDPRYYSAGWMLEVMALGSVFVAAGTVIHPITLSYGHSYRHMWMVFFIGTSLLGCMLLGGWLAGFTGVIVGIAVAQLMDYIIVRVVVAKYRVGDYLPDLLFITVTLLLVFGGWQLRGWPSPTQ